MNNQSSSNYNASSTMVAQQKTTSPWKIYLESSIVGAFRGLVTLPLEHPFDMIKTRMQAKNTTASSFKLTALEIRQNFGIMKGFYAGLLPNSLRVMLKSLYRWPMMIAFPNYYERVLPSSIMRRFEGAHRVSAGFSIAIIESFIICPFERLKVFLMTKSAHVSMKQIAHFFELNQMPDLFTGLKALLVKQIVSWVSFLYIDFKVKQTVKQMQNVDVLSNTSLLGSALLVGVLNTLCTHPIDKVKTLYQMQQNQIYKSTNMLKIFQEMVWKEGISNLYVGWQPRMVQYSIQALFTCSLLEFFEQKLFVAKQKSY